MTLGASTFGELAEGQPELNYGTTVTVAAVAVGVTVPGALVFTSGGTNVTVTVSPVAVTAGVPAVTISATLTASVTVIVTPVVVTVGIPAAALGTALWRLRMPTVTRGRTIGNPRTRTERMQNRLMRHFGTFTAEENVWVLTNGTVTTNQPAEWKDVAHVYFGGHVNIVGDAVKAQLTAAGFTLDFVGVE